jgi:hypothetical protein
LQTVLQERIELNLVGSRGRFVLQFKDGRKIEQSVCEFLLTFSFLSNHNIEDCLLNTDDQFDTVTVPLTGTGAKLDLSLGDYAVLRDVYFHQMFELKLEDMLVRQGVRFETAAAN